MSGIEIERKFLVSDCGFRAMARSHSRIRQGYLCSGGGKTVRVRTSGGQAFLTIKGPSDAEGLSRYEFEKEITAHEAEQLFKLCEPGMIDKTRYLVDYAGHTFEVDEFYGDNEGLLMAEVELASEDEPFQKPPFLGREVTGDRRFYNSHLCRCPFAVWRDTLL